MPYFTPQADGSIALSFTRPNENEFLASLAEQLRNTLLGTELDADHAVPLPLRRLFPVAYVDDEDRNNQYQALTRDELLNTHLEQLQVLERCVDNDVLQPDEIMPFLSGLNAMRLVLGTFLDVSEGDKPEEMLPEDPDDYSPEQFVHLQFLYLGNLLGEAVDAADRAKEMAKES